jgi:hypothetical protein
MVTDIQIYRHTQKYTISILKHKACLIISCLLKQQNERSKEWLAVAIGRKGGKRLNS